VVVAAHLVGARAAAKGAAARGLADTFVKWAPPGGTGFRAALFALFALTIAGTFVFLLLGGRLPFSVRVAAGLLIALSLVATGARLERR